MKKISKKAKKKIKFIISIVTAILGLGTIGTFLSLELDGIKENKIEVENNTGIIVGVNNGIIKNYFVSDIAMDIKRGEEELENYIIEYTPTYVDSNESIIKRNDLKLEGILVKNYSYRMQDISFETLFGIDKIEIKFGPDHPAGYKLVVYADKYGHQLMIDTISCNITPFDEWDNIIEGATIQISPYDFDSDGVNELIVCITDGVDGLCAVFSYTHVDDMKKINPFKQELCIEMQNIICLDGNSLDVLIGTHGIISREYNYVDKKFMTTVW